MSTIDHTHSPAASSWVGGADAHPEFPVQNLPLGVFSPGGESARIGAAIGEWIVDLRALAHAGLMPDVIASDLTCASLNDLFARSPADRLALRHRLFELLTDRAYQDHLRPHLHEAQACQMHLPASIGDYTDFYVGIHHATNIGKQFRPDNPLLPNYKYLPIAYHGRASSIRASGTQVRRPSGQRKDPAAAEPDYGPCRRLDYELEMGVWIAGENALGETIDIETAADRVAGLCLLNDWSARIPAPNPSRNAGTN